ncbi:MAG: hypothetical protein U1F68_14845 [Gammaproteobacteria bacterium]
MSAPLVHEFRQLVAICQSYAVSERQIADTPEAAAVPILVQRQRTSAAHFEALARHFADLADLLEVSHDTRLA